MVRRARRKVVVVGNGMVGHRLCKRLRASKGFDRLEITVFGEEPRPAYDRVHLSDYFAGSDPDKLLLEPADWYAANDIQLLTGDPVVVIDRERRRVTARSGTETDYDELVLATGSSAFVPPAFVDLDVAGVFVYRTIEDLQAIEAYGRRCRRGAVLGGGLLGLEAAKALLDLGLDTTVVEYMPRLMPRQLDDGGAAVLRAELEKIGVEVMTGAEARAVRGGVALPVLGRDSGPAAEAPSRLAALEMGDGSSLATDILVISAGIRPRDELARACGLDVGNRGGVVVDDNLCTSDPRIHAIGEVALHDGVIFGLVAPGYEMADIVASRIAGGPGASVRTFRGYDTSTTLKLVGVDVASFGAPLEEDGSVPIVFEDRFKGVYRKLRLSEDGSRLLGGILVGDTSSYGILHQMCLNDVPCPANPSELLIGSQGPSGGGPGVEHLPAEAQVCSCENVSKGAIEEAIRDQGAEELGAIGKLTAAGTGCGGCKPLLKDLLQNALSSMGRTVKHTICEHFEYTRQELYDIIRVKDFRSFDDLLDAYGEGDGCEVCKPTVASLLASIFAEIAVAQETIQDTNDRFLANIQRGGTYSVVPRVPGGEITPRKLQVLGRVAEKYDLYTKITGGQRVDLFGARVEQLPAIWEELIEAGFESGHAYGKALRTVKSCVGSSWCRYGVQESVGFAIRLENRYKGIRAPHKLKSAVSGCIRECAEAQSKDFGLIATEKGYNLYVGGNGGAKPQHGQLLATDVDEETCVKLIDRYLMFYIRTAEPLTRTAKWLNQLDGGIDYLREVVFHDSLGLCEELEREMDALVQGYECEWAAVVHNEELRKRFTPFVNVDHPDPSIEFVEIRNQKQPTAWV